MTIQSIVENELVDDGHSVWLLNDHREFGYSDGAESEQYLDKVFRSAKDLSSRSSELESHIKDWPSEYHLTSKRSQLLSGFTFDRSSRVLEVGCGCGAITRFLGETFDNVVSIEGSINRARLARLRTRDLDSVSIVCAPFQKIRFSQKFDIIFCIGVYEYSGSFVDGQDPYDAVLRYFADLLAPDGIVVLAIENQFGLKYFSNSREDHLGTMFEGIEGYHRHPGRVRTFGKAELESNLRKYFPCVEFYYPYPDYKLPDCVVSGQFLASQRAGELVSQSKSRDYSGPRQVFWDESTAALELARNQMLEFFANSFIVLAGRDTIQRASFDQLGVIYSSRRRSELSTQTRIVEAPSGQWIVSKRIRSGKGEVNLERLRLVGTESSWIDSRSLQTTVDLRARSTGASLTTIFEPCTRWIALLEQSSTTVDGVRWLAGDHVDAIWPNAYVVDGQCQLVDQEWVWNDRIRMNVVVIRAIHDFLSKIEGASGYATALQARSGRRLIESIASSIGVELRPEDFDDFVSLESQLQHQVFGVDAGRVGAYLRWFLVDRPTLARFRKAKNRMAEVAAGVRRRLSRLTR